MLSVTYLSMSRPANSGDVMLGIIKGTRDTPTFFNTITVYHRPPAALMRRKLRGEYSEREFGPCDIEACTMVVRVFTAVRSVPLMVFGLERDQQRFTVTKVAMARYNTTRRRRSRVLVRALLDVCADVMGIDAYTIAVPSARGDGDLPDVLADHGFAQGAGGACYTRAFTASAVSTPNSNVTAPLDTSTPAGGSDDDVS